MKQLSLIKYTNSQGKEKSFRLINEIQTYCYNLGIELGIDQATLKGLKNHQEKLPDFCSEMFVKWINLGEDVTWRKLLITLTDIQLGGIAKRLRAALNALFNYEQ